MGSTLPVPFWLDNQYYEQLPSILVEPPLEINSPGTFVNEEKEPEIITSEKNSFVDKISSPPHTIGEASCLQTIEPARGLNVEISGSTTELQRFDYQDKPIECYELVDEHFQEVATEQAVVHALCMFKADDTPLIVEPAQILASSAAINDEDDAHVVMDKPSQIENSTPTES